MSDDITVIVQNSLKTVVSFRLGYIYKIIDSGGRVKVIAPNDCLKSKMLLIELGVEVVSIPNFNGLKKLLTYVIINFEILKDRLQFNNVYICHFVSTFVISYITLVPFNDRICVYTEGLGSLFGNNKFLRATLRHLMLSIRGVRLFCNEYERSCIGLPTDHITGGIGINLVDFDMKRNFEYKEEKNLLFVGRLIKDKGVNIAIDTLKEISKSQNVTLHLVGDIYLGNPSSLTQKEIDDLKSIFNDSINFHGYQSDLAKFYKYADVLLLPSKLEGFPVCVMEASMAGLPTVCFDVPGCRDSISTGVNGFLSEPFELSNYIEKVEEALIKSNDMINNCKDYARSNFDRNKKDSDFISILNQLKKCKNHTV
ncbi:glycosyltransferase [Vibrio campbellii]|uniref:glycosyltransferase n=1 Tax=Vibrio campbellii TaxID=680 RepID=UPI003CE4D2A6